MDWWRFVTNTHDLFTENIVFDAGKCANSLVQNNRTKTTICLLLKGKQIKERQSDPLKAPPEQPEWNRCFDRKKRIPAAFKRTVFYTMSCKS